MISEEIMNYQGGVTIVGGATTTVTGIALLPETGSTPILAVVTIAAIVTGAMAVLLQLGVLVAKRMR